MFKGKLIAIYITESAALPMQEVHQVRAQPGAGLEGDRYFNQQGSFSKPNQPDREVTLIEFEAIQALKEEEGIELAPGDARRNLVTQDVPLNHLVGKEFRVGEVLLKGIRLCEPCGHLAKLTHPEVRPALIHRGGLRAQVLSSGVIQAGDPITIV